MRRDALARRDGLDPATRHASAEALARFALALPLAPGAALAAYWPIRSELDVRPLVQALRQRGHIIGLPAVDADGVTLRFRRWQPETGMIAAGFGLTVPVPGTPEIDPDALLVPLAAFDRFGHRIGYGAGHYDRALARLRALRPRVTIGVAFAAQEVDRVPHERHDVALDHILTERGLAAAEPEPA